MEQQRLLLKVMDDGHAKDTDRCAKVLDVKSSGKGLLELLRPFGVITENEKVININCDEHH